VLLVVGDLNRLGVRRGARGLAHDVGGGAVELADVVEGLAVGAPHGRAVLADEVGQPAAVGAVGVGDPDVVVGGAAVALAVPVARPADVGQAVAAGREDAVLGLGDAQAAGPAALDGDGVQLPVGREGRAARGGEQDVLAVGRPAGDD